MSIESQRYRDRAKDCRNMAQESRDREWREALLNMATDFEEEANRIDAEEGGEVKPDEGEA